MFLHSSSRELNNYLIHPEWHLTSDHASLTITIIIIKESVNSTKHSIIKDSNKETAFINDVTLSIRNLNVSNLFDIASLDNVINNFANKVNNAWEKSSKIINITKHSKSWWNENCNRSSKLQVVKESRGLENLLENGQEHQEGFLQSQDSRNSQQETWSLEAYELGQQVKTSDH